MEEAQVGFMQSGPAAWALIPGPAVTAWLRWEHAAPGVALIARVRDVAERHYAVTLAQPRQRDEPGVAARDQARTTAR